MLLPYIKMRDRSRTQQHQDRRPPSSASITAGASAPEVLVQAVIDQLKSLGADSVRDVEGIAERVTFPLPKSLA